MGWTPLLVAHVGAAVVALVLGPFQFARPKGGARHRHLGYVWVVLLVFVSVSSFWIREIIPGRLSPVHVLAAVTLTTLTLGIRAARRGDRRAHRGNMVGTYVGLCGAGLGAVIPPVRLIPTLARTDLTSLSLWAMAFLAAGLAIALSVGPRPARKAEPPA